MSNTREKSERGHAAILRGTLFLGSTAALTGSIFELAELHGHPRIKPAVYISTEKWMILRIIRTIYSAENMLRKQSEQAIFFNIAILLLYLQFQLAYLICNAK